MNYKCCSGGEIEIGSVYAGEMKITLFNNVDRYTLMDGEITLTFHLKLDNGKEETVPMGVFIISEANRNIKTLEITAYDRMLLLDKEFKVTDMVGTPYEILSFMAEDCKIELAQTENEIKSLTNGKEVYSIYADNDVDSWRDVLYYLAQAMCCYATFNRQGKLELRQYGMNPVFEVSTTHRFVSSFSDFKTKYTAISSTNARMQVAEYYALETDDGLTMNLGTNPMIQYGLQKTRERILNNILNQLAVFEYIPFDSQTIGNPALDVGDVIVFKGGHADEDGYSCITSISRTCSLTYVDKLCSIIEKWNLTQYDVSETPAPKPSTPDTVMKFPATPFSVKVIIDDLNYRSEPSMNGTVKGQTGKGVFTIVEVNDGWGRLKSGAGWIWLENSTYCTVGKTVKNTEDSKKSVDEIAKEVIQGKWGNGTERKEKLTAAGYDYATVQKRVNEILAESIKY